MPQFYPTIRLGIDNDAGLHRTAVCMEGGYHSVCLFKTGYGSFKEKCYAVRRCVFCKSNGYLKRRSYTGIGYPKTAVVFRT